MCFSQHKAGEGVPGCNKITWYKTHVHSSVTVKTRIIMIFGERIKKITRAHITFLSGIDSFYVSLRTNIPETRRRNRAIPQ